eukprot:SAG11_NODE_7817_length_1092_cov_2.016113_2_plen_76_part_00
MLRTLTGGLINLYGSTKKYSKIRAGTDPDPTRSILIKNCQTDDYRGMALCGLGHLAMPDMADQPQMVGSGRPCWG